MESPTQQNRTLATPYAMYVHRPRVMALCMGRQVLCKRKVASLWMYIRTYVNTVTEVRDGAYGCRRSTDLSVRFSYPLVRHIGLTNSPIDRPSSRSVIFSGTDREFTRTYVHALPSPVLGGIEREGSWTFADPMLGPWMAVKGWPQPNGRG
jgi:hypothetical protein